MLNKILHNFGELNNYIHFILIFVYMGYYTKYKPSLVPLFINLITLNISTNIGLHRYFSHRQFEFTHSIFENIMWFLSSMAFQNSPFWWAATHRHHHKYTDKENDNHPYNPKLSFFSNFKKTHFHTHWPNKYKSDIPDLRMKKNLVYLEKNINRGHILIIALCPSFIFFGLNGCLSYLCALGIIFHNIMFVNSLCHLIGYQNFDDGNSSKNVLFLLPFLLGDHNHNNHHHRPHSANMAEKYYELDPGYFLLLIFEKMNIIKNLQKNKMIDSRIHPGNKNWKRKYSEEQSKKICQE